MDSVRPPVRRVEHVTTPNLYNQGDRLVVAPYGVPELENVKNSLDREARGLVRDLHVPRPAIYWTDMLVSAAAGWTSFAFAVRFKPFSAPMIVAVLIASLALYRGVCFVHEISHLRHKAVPGFETTWNILLGVPMLIPSFMYVGVHPFHHKISTYGTLQDPEYLPFAGRRSMIALFSLESFVVPILLVVRFMVMAPLSLLSARMHRWIAERASALCINFEYRREVSSSVSSKIKRWEAATLTAWMGLLLLSARRVLPWRFFLVWYLVSAVGLFVNAVRTLGAHRYENDGSPLDREGQLKDSIDTPGAVWTELWAPVGLRYHALHHYFPGIPYHNLGAAYSRLSAKLPPYRNSTSPHLPRSLATLLGTNVSARKSYS